MFFCKSIDISTSMFLSLLLFTFAVRTTKAAKTTKTRTAKTTKTTKSTVTIPYRCHRTVQPGSSAPGEIVPHYIPRPPYVFNRGAEKAPSSSEYVYIKDLSDIESINKSCSIARSVLDKLRTYVRAGVTTEKMDAYAHELIIRRGAYLSYLQYNRFPKSITTSINNIVAYGKPDNTKLRSGDIITVDVAVYFDGYHGACAETFLVDKVDFAGQKFVKAAHEVTYSGINCCRSGEQFATLGRVIEEVAKSRGFKVIPYVDSHGIGQFLQEYRFIFQYKNNHTRSEATMEPGMVFTIGPAITDGKPDCVKLFENSKKYGDNWTLTTVDGSRTALFGRTVLITNDGHKILGY